MSTQSSNSSLERKLTILFSSMIIPIIIILWIGAEIENFDAIPWLTLIIGSVFGLAVAIIVIVKSELILNKLHSSEEDKTKFAKFVLISNFEQLRKIVEKYFQTINEAVTTTKEKRDVLKIILPSVITFLNICETSLPNVGDKLSEENITEINSKFILLHKLIIILGFGSDQKFEDNIKNLDDYTKDTLDKLQEM